MEMEKLYKGLLEQIGEDVNREGLVNTPKRAAKAFKYLNQGYGADLDEIINGALFEAHSQEIVLVKNIELYSLCEHHLLPFIGKCHVAYIPDKKVIGLSKIARIVDVFARRLQIQEKLTKQIADCINDVLKPRGLAVILEAQHECMTTRGVYKKDINMVTLVEAQDVIVRDLAGQVAADVRRNPGDSGLHLIPFRPVPEVNPAHRAAQPGEDLGDEMYALSWQQPTAG